MAKARPNILFGTQEYFVQAGGVGPVTVGLPPALTKKGYNVSVVTPFYDAYLDFYKDRSIEKITSITHIYKGKQFRSDVFRICVDVVDGHPVYHYLIKPEEGSPVGWLFNIEKDGSKIYHSFKWSEAHNRREYFNSAVAAMLRMPDNKLPEFDIYHSHTWHTGLAGVIAKEMDHLPKWQEISNNYKKPLKKIPYMVSTVHMLLSREHGQLTTSKSVRDFFLSLGFPGDFSEKFSAWDQYINSGHLKQVVLVLLYSDQVTTVSEGLAHEAAHIKGGGQGLDALFEWLDQQNRFEGILNGITHAKFDATSQRNLNGFAIRPEIASADKYRIKQLLHAQYPQLDPDKMWFGFVGRLADEKGMDMLLPALDAITKENGVFIVMGRHVVTPKTINGKVVHEYQWLVDELRKHPNVLVIDDKDEQNRVGSLIRAATDCTTMLSHNEACGLPQIEGFANGSFAIAPAIQGLPDSVKDLDQFPDTGTGYLYNDTPTERYNNVKEAITKAAKFYRTKHADGTIDQFLQRILTQSKQFDWHEVPAQKYQKLYQKILQRPLLRLDQIRTIIKPMLSLLSVFKQTASHKGLVGPRKVIPNKLEDASDAPTEKVKGKIFVIGPNKCGTQTIYYGFLGNKVSSLHYGTHDRSIASIMYENRKLGRKLMYGLEEFDFFADMEDIYAPERPLYAAFELFKELDAQYPNSKFILNTRDKTKWLISRFGHNDPISGVSYVEYLCSRYQITPEQLLARWSKEWDDHHAAVRAYFVDRPGDLLEYNIETDDPQKISAFFADLNLDPGKFQHANQSNNNNVNRALICDV